MSTRALFLPFTLLFVLPACDPGAEPSNADLYRDAVEDASVPEPDEVVTDLIAIRPGNTELEFDAEGRVLMVTWTSYKGYDGMEGQAMPLGAEVWTTTAPELPEFCQGTGLQAAELSLRLEQRMGLPMANGKDRIVALWVPPAGLFRPSLDPEIDDSTASLVAPPGTDPAHIQWIEDLRAASYGDEGYPWTQLGYTYDWSPDADSEVGFSEFVARAGTEVVVERVVGQDEYCR